MTAELQDLDWLSGAGERDGIVELALAASSMVMWRFALANRALTWTAGLDEVLGLAGAGEAAVAERLRDLIAPMTTAAQAAPEWQDFELEQPLDTAGHAARYVQFRARVLGEGKRRALIGIATDITERHESRQALTDLAERYRLLVDLSPDAIGVHQQGIVVYANPATLRILGAEPGTDLVGRPITDLVHPDSIPEMQRRLSALSGPGEASEPAEAVMMRFDDTTIVVESVSVRTMWEGRPAIQVILRDITAQKAAEAAEDARRRAEQYFTTVVASLAEGVIVIGTSGLVEAVNPAAQRIFNIDEADAIGVSASSWTLFDEAGRPLSVDRLPTAITARTGRTLNNQVLSVHRKDGQRLWLSLSCHPLQTGDGGPYGVVASFTDITERRAISERLAFEATHDPLTGLANRALLSDWLTAVRNRGGITAALFVDIDKFKVINDSLGHGVGDQVLQIAGRRLQNAVRGADVVARLGGDEFVVAATIKDPADAVTIADNLIDALRGDPFDVDGRRLHVNASIGIVVAPPGDTRNAEELLRDADLAMYQAKTEARGRHVFFDVELRERTQRRLQLDEDLRAAIGREELWTAYQPVVELPSGRMVGAEALVRWTHPEHGFISPVEFIPLAEESGTIHALGSHVLRESCRLLAARRPDLHVAVNLSAVQLDDPDLTDLVRRTLSEAGLPPSALVLEITESMLMRDHVAATRKLNELRDLGVRLAIDDFGTGYSSLAQLRRLPLDTLKIDRSFVMGLGESRDAEAIVTSIIAMAHAVDLTVIAEGVETAEQLAVLQRLNCDQAQGYYFGRPETAEKVFG
jgi:diguanylate cyclase (GGDEF)-like protein/PAS domain S-box-containing protein